MQRGAAHTTRTAQNSWHTLPSKPITNLVQPRQHRAEVAPPAMARGQHNPVEVLQARLLRPQELLSAEHKAVLAVGAKR